MENKLTKYQSVHTSVSMLSQALQSEKICNVPKLELDKILLISVHKAFSDKGQRVDPADMDYIVDNLADSVLFACPFVRIEEIPIAIQKGILGDYGEYFGLNVSTFTNFVKLHYTSLNRANLAKQSIVSTTKVYEPTESEIFERDKDLLIQSFEWFKSKGFFEDHGNYIYKIAAKKLGVLRVSDERQKEYLTLGKTKAVEKLRNDLLQRPMERQKIGTMIVEATDLKPGTDGIKLVYKEALQIAIINWFKELLEFGTEIKDLLTDQ